MRGLSLWPEEKQEEVLHFLLAQLDEQEPETKESLAHLTWEWVRKRVHLDLAPTQALPRLVALAQTPLADAIRADMENPRTSDQEADSVTIPLRVLALTINTLPERLDQDLSKLPYLGCY